MDIRLRKMKECKHDSLIVHWEGQEDTASIKCKDCGFVLWDKSSKVRFADAMNDILKEYENDA